MIEELFMCKILFVILYSLFVYEFCLCNTLMHNW